MTGGSEICEKYCSIREKYATLYKRRQKRQAAVPL